MQVIASLRRPALRGVGIGLTCAVASWLLVNLSFLRGVEDWMLDGCFSLRGKRTTTAKVVIVGLDEDSLDALGKPTAFLSPELAAVVRHAHKQGATAIGVDVLVPASMAKWPEMQQGKAGDAWEMSQAIVETGSVVLPLMLRADGDWLEPLPRWLDKSRDDPESTDLGFVNLQEDPDQFVRRQQLLGKDRAGKKAYPHFALALFARSRGQAVEWNEAGEPVVGGETFPVDINGRLRINFVGPPGSFPVLSFRRVLEDARMGHPTPELNGAVVIVGITARDQQDYHSTPYANNYMRWLARHKPGRMAGPEIHAHVLATLHDRAFIRTPPWLATLPLLLVFGILLGHAFARLSLGRGLAVAVVHHFAWKAVALGAFAGFHWRVEMTAMLLLGFLAYGATFALRWRTLRRMFGVVKSEALALALEADPARLDAGGEEREVTVLFADIRGFTDFSEKHTAHEVVALVNAYFQVVVPAIEAEGGVIDKYMGDGIMALFGAPAHLPDHALRAARAAVAMVQAVHAGREKWAKLGNAGLRIGVGVHTGRAVVGAIGSPGRLDYTVIGDTVNAASRIESENKTQGTEVLLSSVTCALLSPQQRATLNVEPQRREVKVKGREEKLLLFAVRVP